MALNDDDVREILRIIDESDLDELRIETDGLSLHVLRGGAPYSTGSPLSTYTSAIVPATPAWTEFIIFITSMMQTIVSGSTREPTSTNGASPGAGAR